MADKVFLLLVLKKRFAKRKAGDEFEEMRELVYSCGGNVVDSLVAKIDNPAPKYYLREGKLLELKAAIKLAKAKTVCVNIDLSPAQSRNIEEFLGIRVVDRTALILDIFAKHAKSRDGKLQVELAQYTYLLPRLSAIWEKLSKLGGGIGTRGPGEKILERDKRKIRKHITRLNKELDKLSCHRKVVRASRKRKAFPIVSIVGYTNAGKSTLLQKMTGADIIVEDKLFATLDPVTRKYRLRNGREILFSDTVGFLLDLPHNLIKAFHSTLEEVNEADLILIVLDIQNPEHHLHYKVVQDILKEVNAEDRPQMVVFNKVDGADEARIHQAGANFPGAINISALQGIGIDKMLDEVAERLGIKLDD